MVRHWLEFIIMITITLPDGSLKQFEHAVTVHEVAATIGAGLAKAALAGRVNDKLVDTSYLIQHDARVAIITERDAAGLEVIRHSTAHLLAQAVKQLFPEAQVTIGPVIEDGFYYDFAFERGFTPDDLTAIEKRMSELADADSKVERNEISRADAIKLFSEMGEHYKVKIIQDIPGDESLSFYRQGNFIDLCRGPHVPSTGKLKYFKLMKVAGAYWRGNSDNEMLQRIYGTAWTSKKELMDYLTRLEEAEKRDHRKLAKKLDLFHIQEEAPGMVFWHDKGWTIYQIMEQYIRAKLKKFHYQEVKTPQVVSLKLWQQSGHWEKFGEEMFTTSSKDTETGLPEFAIKPMSCPCHVQIFKQGFHSYRDLPLRMAEFGACHRNEPSGSLHGLMRVRSMVQDDAHVFCTAQQVEAEVFSMINFVYEVYQDFGFDDLIVKLSTRPEKRIGSDEVWDKAEAALAQALTDKKIEFDYNPGEGAFYGPKIEFSLKDCIGRVWQCGTVQLDFSTPERLEAKYIAEDGSKQTPIMIHRAILGSMERFIGILIEHYAGHFPVWLAPVQVMVLNITDTQANYVNEVCEKLQNHGLRAKVDLRNEKIGFKIREHSMQHVPFLLVLGDNEIQSQTVTVRTQQGENLGAMRVEDFVELVKHTSSKLGRLD